MPLHRIKYRFKAKAWKYNGPNGWWFVSLPNDISAEIRSSFKDLEEGWGRLSASAAINKKEWKTAIWFDSKQGVYLLPLKADIRKGLDLEKDLTIDVLL